MEFGGFFCKPLIQFIRMDEPVDETVQEPQSGSQMEPAVQETVIPGSQ